MELKFITCSGTNETTPIPELLQLLSEFPRAEIGVQVSDRKGAFGTPRYDWIHSLWKEVLLSGCHINAALHINLKWVENFGQGVIAPELDKFFSLAYENGQPFFQRAQLNFKIGREKAPDIDMLYVAIRHYYRHRFILSYNQSNRHLIHEMYIRAVDFDCLYDESFGAGIVPDERKAPAYINVLQGYAGGINPDNVTEELSKIIVTDPDDYCSKGFYIDAHKGLEDEQTRFDLNKCRTYLTNAEGWYQDYLYCKTK